jgi:hypothetical protein
MGHVLCAGTQMEHGKKLCTRVDGQPEPQHVFGAAEPGAQFVQLEVREPEMAEEALVQGLRVLTSTGQPGSDRGLAKAEDTLSSRRIQPFGQRRQHQCDLMRGVFRRYKGVLRLEVKVVRQAWQRNVWIRSA